jgi:hypothetical protein
MVKALGNIDRRLIYLILIVLVLWPLVKPIGLPVSVGPWTRSVYDTVSTLTPGDVVIMSLDYSIGGAPDVHPQAVAMAKHVFEKGGRIIFMAFVDQGVIFIDEIVAWAEKNGKVYGQDFCDVGYLAGIETAIAAMASDFYVAFPEDRRGNATNSIAMLSGYTGVQDTKMILEFATGNPGPMEWIRQVYNLYKIPMMAGLVTVMAPQTEPYYQAGQLFGILAGLRGAAEYEIASGIPGKAAAGMDAQSLGHFVIIGFTILGNIVYAIERSQKAKKTSEVRG